MLTETWSHLYFLPFLYIRFMFVEWKLNSCRRQTHAEGVTVAQGWASEQTCRVSALKCIISIEKTLYDGKGELTEMQENRG